MKRRNKMDNRFILKANYVDPPMPMGLSDLTRHVESLKELLPDKEYSPIFKLEELSAKGLDLLNKELEKEKARREQIQKDYIKEILLGYKDANNKLMSYADATRLLKDLFPNASEREKYSVPQVMLLGFILDRYELVEK